MKTKKGNSRKKAIQALFQMEMNNESDEYVINLYNDDLDKKTYDTNFFKFIIKETINKQNIIDNIIKNNLPDDWKLSRLGYIERAIFRLATCEFIIGKYNKNIIISQYVNLASIFIDKKSSSFINAILEKIYLEQSALITHE